MITLQWSFNLFMNYHINYHRKAKKSICHVIINAAPLKPHVQSDYHAQKQSLETSIRQHTVTPNSESMCTININKRNKVIRSNRMWPPITKIMQSLLLCISAYHGRWIFKKICMGANNMFQLITSRKLAHIAAQMQRCKPCISLQHPQQLRNAAQFFTMAIMHDGRDQILELLLRNRNPHHDYVIEFIGRNTIISIGDKIGAFPELENTDQLRIWLVFWSNLLHNICKLPQIVNANPYDLIRPYAAPHGPQNCKLKLMHVSETQTAQMCSH